MTTSAPGFHLALMGIDGVGKSTLIRELAETARSQGLPVRTVSWRSVVEEEGEGCSFPKAELRRLWVESFRAYFGGARTAQGTPVELPTDFADLYARGGTEYLNGVRVHGLRPEGALASAWIELAANTLLHQAVIEPAVAEGCAVLQESYGYKHLLKLFAYTEHLSPDMAGAASVGRALVADHFGRVLQPDVGVYVAGDPRTALRWRQRQSALGTFETFASSGESAESSFVQLQEHTATAFARFAEIHGWTRVDVLDVPRAQNRRRILAALARSPLADRLDLGALGDLGPRQLDLKETGAR
ncbi:hypothetical protein C6Y14_22805 [Streptomyces dioscori]|uniref:Thymidylate kinase n=1 Tax=Streptomyces dioscori TaxID=2109333 RepID=A0A2P8Q3N0_9ACTN|nr:hypothetical protein [Streptomyces dioscori]PSM40848.1 hypothetical protein C6Y14_22805 [Streptomyces dioscori]